MLDLTPAEMVPYADFAEASRRAAAALVEGLRPAIEAAYSAAHDIAVAVAIARGARVIAQWSIPRGSVVLLPSDGTPSTVAMHPFDAATHHAAGDPARELEFIRGAIVARAHAQAFAAMRALDVWGWTTRSGRGEPLS